MDAIAKPTIEETAESLTGFEEIAIRREFGADLSALPDTTLARALVFVLLCRESGDPTSARNEVMKMTLRAVMDSFGDTPDGSGND